MLAPTRIGAALLLALFLATPALADQSSLCIPTSGLHSGLELFQAANAALKALATSNSGDTAPVNDCSGVTLEGQLWLDTSTTPATVKMFDGATQQVIGRLDDATGIWTPPVGGGAGSVASAATADLWSVAPAAVTITGSTTITKLSTAAPTGQIKFVRFAGALTLTYNATQLITPTADNIATEAGDTAVVQSLGGGNVRLLVYQRATGRPLTNPVAVGDSGSGGTAGLVPPAPAGSAALGKVYSAGGTFAAPVPVGTILPYAGLSAPGGYLMAYGQAVSRTTYSDLWAALHVSATVTVSIASPAVVTWTGHGLTVGSPVSFATSGALPTGLSAATTYYVISAGYGSDSFELSATRGGAAINTSGTQSGTQTGTYAPYGAGDYSSTFNVPDLRGRVLAGQDDMGGTSANRLTAARPEGLDGDVQGAAGGEEQHQLTIAEMPAHNHQAALTNSGGSGAGIARGSGSSVSTGAVANAGGDEAHNIVQPTLIANYIIRY